MKNLLWEKSPLNVLVFVLYYHVTLRAVISSSSYRYIYSSFCHQTRETNSQNLVNTILQIVLLDVDEVKISALKSILDLLQVYGLETFKVTPAEQAIVEAEQSVLEPENENHDDDDDEVSDGEEVDCDDEGNDNDDDNGGEEGCGSNGESSDDNNAEKVDEEVIINEAQKSVSHVLYVLIKCLEKEVCYCFKLIAWYTMMS